MSVPGSELVVSRGPHHPQEKYRDPDLYTVLNEAFEAAERQLTDFKHRQRGDVKNHRPGGGGLPAES
jgi:ribosome-associated translation inhibitor RaiA